MNKLELQKHPNIVDNRERCPTCNMIEPQHHRWCITPVIQGKTTMETREIQGEQNISLLTETGHVPGMPDED